MVEYKTRDIFLFLIIFSAVFLFLWFFVDIRNVITYIVGKLLNCSIYHNYLVCSNKEYHIIKECTGILSIAFLLSILIFERNRINTIYIIVGIFAIIIWNILRISLVILSGGNNLIHSSTWFISVAIVLFFTYLAYMKSDTK